MWPNPAVKKKIFNMTQKQNYLIWHEDAQESIKIFDFQQKKFPLSLISKWLCAVKAQKKTKICIVYRNNVEEGLFRWGSYGSLCLK